MDDLGKTWMFSSNLPWHNYFVFLIYSTNIRNFHQYLHVCAQLQETPIELLQKLHKQLARKETLTSDSSCYLFTQLSIWRSNSLGNGFTSTILSIGFNAFKQQELPCRICWKNAFCGSNSNKTRRSVISSFSRLQNKCKSDPIVKLRSLG
jgi:hypothetical protein